MSSSIAYGPVPSRRLGRSLGINNIPPKKCSYSCVYCQVGITRELKKERDVYYEPREIARQVAARVEAAQGQNEAIDYLAFVPDGEPTLDRNLGEEIELLHPLGIPVAVITNASLMDREDVRHDLNKADWVCCKVDAVTPGIWKKVNRPHPGLDLDSIMEGIIRFSQEYQGKLVTETMLVHGINEAPEEILKIAGFLAKIRPACVYLSVPTRPPAEDILPASAESVDLAYGLLLEKLDRVECLTGYEGNSFVSIGTANRDILDITSVHPMREDAVADFLKKAGQDRETIDNLLEEGKLAVQEFQGKTFYRRTFKNKKDRAGSEHV